MPKTHFYYDGKADLESLVRNGIRLWHEEAESRSRYPLTDLWKTAESLFPEGADMSAEGYALLVMGDSLVPSIWEDDKAFPYKPLFAASFYFLEARRLSQSNLPERAWPPLVQAYYFLGINSSEMTSYEAASKNATKRHFSETAHIREIIVKILQCLKKENNIKSATQARQKIIEIIKSNKQYTNALKEYDQKIPARTKKQMDYTAHERLFVRMEAWHSPNSPYPEIVAAFDSFIRKNKR